MSNIIFVKGNAVDALVNGDIDFLLNQVNCQNKYASGIAKEIGDKIPAAKRAYHNYCEFHAPDKSKMLGGTVQCDGVIHLFAQEYYGRDGKRYTHYGHLAQGLDSVFFEAQDADLAAFVYDQVVIGVPDMIGCGLGGADRDIVLELIEGLLGWAKELRIYSL